MIYHRIRFLLWNLGISAIGYHGRVYIKLKITIVLSPKNNDSSLPSKWKFFNIAGSLVNEWHSKTWDDKKCSVSLFIDLIFNTYIRIKNAFYSDKKLVIFFNCYSLHARLHSHYKAWSYKKKKQKKIKAHRKSV